MKRALALGALAVAGLVAGSCKSYDGADSPVPASAPDASTDAATSSTKPTEATIDALMETYCQRFVECTSDLTLRLAFGSPELCRSRQKTQLLLDLQAPGDGTTEAAANGCLTAAKSVACSDLLHANLRECLYKGTLADGSPCTSDSQCQSGSCFMGGAACGKCGPRAALGADCTNASCDPSLKCSTAHVCAEAGIGASCAEDADCFTFLYCRAGTCKDTLGEGAACATSPQPADPPCDVLKKGLFCLPGADAGAATCQRAAFTFASTGEKCGLKSLAPLEVSGCIDGTCEEDRCLAYLPDGAACGLRPGDAKCAPPAECRSGVCTLRDYARCK